MQKYDLNALIEFNLRRFTPKVLIHESDRRMMLISMCAGHELPEHSAPGKVTVHVVQGHVTFSESETSCDLHTGEIVCVESGSKHTVQAHADSVLLVTITGMNRPLEVSKDGPEVLDIREVPGPLRHPKIFAKFDALDLGEALRLINDHDPVPLNRQFELIRPGQARWEYERRGPEIFRVCITRVGPASVSDRPVQSAPQGLHLHP